MANISTTAPGATNATPPLVNSEGIANPNSELPQVQLYNATSETTGSSAGEALKANAAAGSATGAPPEISQPASTLDTTGTGTGSSGTTNVTGNTGIGTQAPSSPSGNTIFGTDQQVTGVPPGLNPAGDSTGAGSGSAGGGFQVGGGAGGSNSGTFGKIVDYVGNHPVLGLGALQSLGGLISGATSTLTPAQVSQLNAQAAANNAAAALVSRQTSAQSQPKSVASLAPVTGTPAPLLQTGPPPGLINVTGVPA
jgi:hypothetical protein